MAQDESKQKEEEKLEFDSAGQAVAYISLDQARVLALRHARDNRDFYGRRYRRRELAWEVLDEEEREDYYYIRLSYRPARGVRGEPGVELITIDKAGPVELRQILSEPRPKFRTGLVLSAVGMLAIAGAIVGGLFAAGVFSSSTADTVSVMVETDSLARLVSPDGGVTVDVDAGAASAPSRLSYRSLSSAEIPVLPEQYKVTNTAFDLTMDDADLLKPLTITVRLSAADAVLAGSVEDNIVIQHHRDGAWTSLLTAVDFGASTAQAQVNSLSMFALTIRKPEPNPTPTREPTPTEAPTPTLTPVPAPTPVPTPTVTPAPAPTPVSTPPPTATPAPVPTATAIPTPTPTPTRVPTPTLPTMYLLEATVHSEGLGRIGLNPANDNGRYNAGTLVRATAGCDAGFVFEGWTGDVPAEADPSSRSIIVVVDRDRKLVASCAEPPPPPSHALTINGKTLDPGQLMLDVPNGTITLNQSPGPAGKFEAGARVVLLATPTQPDFQVTWSGVDSVDGKFGRLEMREDREVEVTIERPHYTLAAGANPLNGGSVSGGGQYLSGTYATLQAMPSLGWQFTGWEFVGSSGACSAAASCIVVMDSHKSVIANFQAIGATPVPTPTAISTPTPTHTPTPGPTPTPTPLPGSTPTPTPTAAPPPTPTAGPNMAPLVEVHIGNRELDVASAPYSTVLAFRATVTDDHDPDSFFNTGGQSPMVWTSNLGRSEPGPWGDTILWKANNFVITPEGAGLVVGTHIITGTATDSGGLVGSGSAQITITPD